MEHRRPTLAQVALHAGVSRSTAGAALAGSPRVAASTAARVREAAVSLGYRTEPHARLLRRGGPDVANVVLDTRLTHATDGSLHPFWARVVTGFIARMQHQGWLCVMQLLQPGLPLLPAPAPGVVLATADTGNVSMFVHDTFGQTVVSPVSGSAPDMLHVLLHHDFDAVGRACADHLHDAGCRDVLLLGRTGFGYSDAIMHACEQRLNDLGVATTVAPPDGSTAHRLATGLGPHVDGLLDLSAEPAALLHGLQGRTVVAGHPAPSELVVLSNADGTDHSGRSAIARLSLEGRAVGELAAEVFLQRIEGGRVDQPSLPFAIYAGET